MRGDAAQFDALVERFTKLGRRDRRAVLASLGPGERAMLEREIAVAQDERRREQDSARRADRQFVGYSAWLGAVVADAVSGGNDEANRTGACIQAIAQAQRAASEQHPAGTPFGQFLRQLGIPGLGPAADKRP